MLTRRIARDSSPILKESPMTASIRRATPLRPGQFKHLIRVASMTGRLPERDVMLFGSHIPLGFASPNWPCWKSLMCCIPAGLSSPKCIYAQKSPRAVDRAMCICPILDALTPWKAGSLFACGAAGAFLVPTNTEACTQVRSWLPQKGQPLNWLSSIVSWTEGQRFTGLVISSNKPLAGSIGQRVSSSAVARRQALTSGQDTGGNRRC